MSKHYARQHKLEKFFIDQVRSTFRWTVHMQRHHMDHIESMSKATQEHPDWAKMTAHTRGTVEGYKKALWDQIYTQHVTWGFFWSKHPGKCFPAHGPKENRLDEQPDWTGYIYEKGRFEGQHFWKNDDGTIGPAYW